LSHRFRKYSALFLLLLFLFPTVTELVHEYIHYEDVHCTQTGLHFHQAEHHCAIDDFVHFIIDVPSYKQFTVFVTKVQTEFITFFRTASYTKTSTNRLSLRGPPIIV
jgi:hypothetical protein